MSEPERPTPDGNLVCASLCWSREVYRRGKRFPSGCSSDPQLADFGRKQLKTYLP